MEWTENVVRMHEKDILELTLKNQALQKQMDKNNARIEELRGYNREIKGRPTESKPLELWMMAD